MLNYIVHLLSVDSKIIVVGFPGEKLEGWWPYG